MKKFLSILIVGMCFSAMLFAGGSGEESETIDLKWQVWITPNLDRSFYDNAAAVYMAENPNVSLEIVEVTAASGVSAVDFIRNRLAGGDVPDIWTNVSNINLINAGHVWQLPDDDPYLASVNNVDIARLDGKLYGFLPHVQPTGAVFYNKSLWAEAGLTEADIPTTWDEFEAVCAQLDAAGIVPIMAGGEWTAPFLLSTILSTEVVAQHQDFWAKYRNGEIKFTDPEVLEVAKFIDRLVKKGYFIEGQLSIGYAQLEQGFLDERAAMYPMGTWYTAADANADKDWETGVFAFPTRTGDITNFYAGYGLGGNSMRVYADSEHPEAAWEFVKWFHRDPVIGAKAIEVDGLYSNFDPPILYDMTPLQNEVLEVLAHSDLSTAQITEYLGDFPPSGIFDALQPVIEAIILQRYDSLEDEFAKLDTYSNDNF